MEALQAKHRKEQRDLQARITQKKKSATKKTRKTVNDECERLQRELIEKHRAEIAQLNGESDPATDEPENVNLDDLTLEEKESAEQPDNPTPAPSTPDPSPSDMARLKKPSRQKARLARRVAEREAEAERAADEAANQTDHRKHERKIMDEAFARLGLKEIEIRPDGHCLYSAVAHQLLDAGMPLTAAKNGDSPVSSISSKNDHYREVRATTADFLLANADDFAPFLEEPIDAYARKIKLTTEWGGQLELQAIARAYGIHINVIQGDGRIEKFEPGDTDADVEGKEPRTIWLAYYRHTYGLGEHYNALTK